MNLITLFISAVFIENVVLSNFLGLCPFLGVSKNKDDAIGMGLAVTFVMFVSGIITYLINKFVLVPAQIEYMQLIIFILIIASFVQMVEMFLKAKIPALYKSLGVYLPLITTNCAVLFVALNNVQFGHNFVETAVYSLGIPLGFMLVLYLFATIRGRLDGANVPKYFKGNPIGLITAGLMALAFSGLVGIV